MEGSYKLGLMDRELGSPTLQTPSFNMALETKQVCDLPSTPGSVCESFHGPLTTVCGMQTGAVPQAFPLPNIWDVTLICFSPSLPLARATDPVSQHFHINKDPEVGQAANYKAQDRGLFGESDPWGGRLHSSFFLLSQSTSLCPQPSL